MLNSLLTFAGGIGLFLLGMRLITDGLKVAAGNTLRQILVSATRNPLRALGSGVLITTVVQSSSSVVFATVGFVNAGLLSLQQAVGVIYGANVGTTLTSWLVALAGFNLPLQAMAMPLVGLGMALWIGFGSSARGALGQALVGFGIFFLGIDVLRESFAGIGDTLDFARLEGYGALSLLLFVLIGFVLTVLMQSSSATLAVVLTAAGGGVIPLSAAAAMVIGANVGTTSTAVFAIIGATAPAKRAALAHVGFNVITGAAALILFPALFWLVSVLAEALRVSGQPALFLAIFHTLTKLLGLAVMWPLTSWFVRRLETLFTGVAVDEFRPRYLDRNVQGTPSLAVDALTLELHEMGGRARSLATEALSREQGEVAELEETVRALRQLNLDIGEFASGIHRLVGDSGVTSHLPDALRVAQYWVEVAEGALEIARRPPVELADGELPEPYHQLYAQAVEVISLSAPDEPPVQEEALAESLRNFEDHYQALKLRLLRAGTTGLLPPRQMARAIEQIGDMQRLVNQSAKAARYLQRFRHNIYQQAVEPAAA